MAVGQVKFTIYFGTNFDDLNIPYYNDLIRKSASKTLELSGQYVWQNTWLSEIRVNIENYQDIVGAQYVEVSDEGTTSRGSHWYEVRGYQQLSRKTAELIIEYDPLLSIQVSNISGIYGTMKRWTVNAANDSHFRWIYTSEPIDQAEKFTYSYFRHSCVDETKSLFPVVGFPYDMSEAPIVEPYKNQDMTNTNIYYPKMAATSAVTKFQSTANESINFDDGMTYYLWRPKSNDIVYMSYNKAVGLGFDLVSNAYMLPASSMYTMQLGDNGALISISGKVVIVDSGFALYDTEYENNKANDLGIFFTLYNEVSGESVTLANYDLTNTQLELTCDPYSNGRFYARFKGYFGDINGWSGQVMSAPFKSYSVNSSTPFNVESATRMINSQINSISNQYQAQKTANFNQSIMSGISTGFDIVEALASAGTGHLGISANTALSTAVAPAALGPAIAVVGAAQEMENIKKATFSVAKSGIQIGSIYEQYQDNKNILRTNRNNQIAMLRSTGTLGKVSPPPFKLNTANGISGASYTFVVKRSDLSTNDKNRANKFFRWYGYNVDNLPLNDVSQLYARDNFTFIQADNVVITDTKTATNMSRLHDSGTIAKIQERFSSGIRIWQINPDFDTSKANKAR